MNDFETRYMNKNVWTKKTIDFGYISKMVNIF